MLADAPQETDFYLALDDYPVSYITKLTDYKQMFTLSPTQAGYSNANGFFGTYYTRVRPNYTLADILKQSSFNYFFRAFSQPTGNAVTDIFQNDNLTGVAFKG